MFKKFGVFLFGLLLLAGCGMPRMGAEWGAEWGRGPVEAPTEISEFDMYGHPEDDNIIRTVAVLLPLSGPGGQLGTGIQNAIEIAFFKKQPRNILVSFHDLSGTTDDKRRIIDMVLYGNPDLIIGPLFSDDVQLLRDVKPRNIPAITFTSARHVLGDGIFTLALLPNQAVEAVIKHMRDEGKQRLLILSPDTTTGYMLANNALEAARIYGLDLAGLYFFEEHNPNSMKELAKNVALYEDRVANLTRAREILSDVLINQRLTPAERDAVRLQLEDFNRRDSLGGVPYDAILFLSNAADSKTLGAYLRYFDISANVATFFGSALWDTEIVFRDSALSGGRFAALPRISPEFTRLFSEIEGVRPNRFNTIGYDAAMLAMKALSGGRPVGAVLLDPSGYRGLDGLFRLRPNGENERALQIMQLNGVRLPALRQREPQDFTQPIFRTTRFDLNRPAVREIRSSGYNPIDFIELPDHIQGLYNARTFGATDNIEHGEEVITLTEFDGEIVTDEEFSPAQPAPVNRRLIDEVRMRQ